MCLLKTQVTNSTSGLFFSATIIAVVVVFLNSLAVLSYHREVASLPLQAWYVKDVAIQTPQQAQQISPTAWIALDESNQQLGYGIGPVWVKLQFQPKVGYAIDLQAAFLDDVRFYVLTEQGAVLDEMLTGDQRAFATRRVPSSSLMLPIAPTWQDQPYQYFIRIKNTGGTFVPLKYLEMAPQLALEQQRQVLHGFFLGVMVFAALLGVLLAIVSRWHSLSLFSGLILCIAAVQAEINGFTFQWLWPTHPEYNQLVEWCIPLAIYCCSSFIRQYFQFQVRSWPYRIFQGFMVITGLMLLITLLFQVIPNYQWQSQLKLLGVYLMQACVLCTLLVSILMLRTQRRQAALFLLPMSVLLGSIVLAALRVTGIIDESALTLIALELGTTLAAILMSSSLVLKMYLDKVGVSRTQQALLERNQQLSQLQQQELNRSKISPFYALGSRLALVELLQHQLKSGRVRYRLLLIELQNHHKVEAVLGRQKTNEIVQAYLDSLLLFCNRNSAAIVSLGGERQQTIFALTADRLAILVQEDAFVTILTNLRRLLNQKFSLEGLSPDFKPRYASVQISTEFGVDAEALIAHGCLALTYVQKAAGHLTYQQKLGADSLQRLELLTQLSKAISQQQFHLLFQPVQQLSNQQTQGLEAFIRWTHPQIGPVSPAVFIPLAEEAGLISSITAWVYKEVRKVQNQLYEQGIALQISINLSALDLENTTLISNILQREQKYPVAQRLKFELAESAMDPDSLAAQKSIELLGETGTNLIMDDFGAGQSMLTKLGSLPIAELKMDMALLSLLGTKRENLLAGAIRLGKSIDLKIICEGVEHQRQLDFLMLHDVDAVQGYLIAKPMPLPELIKWLNQAKKVGGSNSAGITADAGATENLIPKGPEIPDALENRDLASKERS